MTIELTERERVVLTHLCEGRVVAEIAELEHVAVSTVRSQVKAILHKLGVHSQVAAVAIGCREVAA